MFVISVKDNEMLPFSIGRQGENEARKVEFDFSSWREYGNGNVYLAVQRPEGEPYPVDVEVDGDIATWVVTSIDTAYDGTGEAQLFYVVNDVTVKSQTYPIRILPSVIPSDNPPDPYENWLEEMIDVKDTAVQSAQDASEYAEQARQYATAVYTDTGDGDIVITR